MEGLEVVLIFRRANRRFHQVVAGNEGRVRAVHSGLPILRSGVFQGTSLSPAGQPGLEGFREAENVRHCIRVRVRVRGIRQGPEEQGEIGTSVGQNAQQILDQRLILVALQPDAKLLAHAALVGLEEQFREQVDGFLCQCHGLVLVSRQQR